MPLLKLPEPVIAQRRYFARIEEPLALTMERYAEFLGTDNLDHVVSQGLNSSSNATASANRVFDPCTNVRASAQIFGDGSTQRHFMEKDRPRFGERYPNTTQVLGSLASTMDMSASSRTDNSSLTPPRRIP